MFDLWFYLMLLVIFVAGASSEAAIYKIPLVHSRNSVTMSKRSISPDTSRHGNLRGRPGQGYYVEVYIGTPPQRLNVLIDTGSSNFAVACDANPYIEKYFHRNESKTFTSDGTHVSVPYTQGNWEGFVASDTVTIPSVSDLSIRVDFACIIKSDGFFISGSNWNGILGLAYPAIAKPSPTTTPFFDQLVKEKSISNVFSLQLGRQSDDSDLNAGTLTLGGIDSKLYTGNIIYAPLRREWYYDIVLAGLKVGDVPVQVDCKELNVDKTVVDSGTTNFRLPRKVFAVVVDMLKRQVNLQGEKIPDSFWNGGSYMCWDSGLPIDAFPRLVIAIAHSQTDRFSLSIPPQNYLLEFHNVDSHYGSFDSCYTFAISSSDTGTVLGNVILEGFYVIFDRQNKQIGFAQLSDNDHRLDRSVQSFIYGPWPASGVRVSLISRGANDSQSKVQTIETLVPDWIDQKRRLEM